MPAALQKVPALGGRGFIFEYANRPGRFFYRELVEGQRKYRSIIIKGALTLEEAQLLVIDAYGELREGKNRLKSEAPAGEEKRREQVSQTNQAKRTERENASKNCTIEEAVSQFLQAQSDKTEAGLLNHLTLKEKRQVLQTHLVSYLKSEGIHYVHEIERLSFERYPLFRKETTKLTKKKESGIIRDFIRNHLVKHSLINSEIGLAKDLLPSITIKKEDLVANPAINGEDWLRINTYIRKTYVKQASEHPRKSVEYWRMLFWTFTIVAKNTGCRPNELIRLRWKDVQVEDIGGVDPKTGEHRERLIAHIIVVGSKTGEQREIPANVGDAFKRWKDYQIEYIEQYKPNLKRTQETLVFGNPSNEMRPFSYTTYTAAWKRVMEGVEKGIKGNRFSSKRYTIYSMRSTFIENNLAKGMDIFLLARICGHSVAILMKHYERLDIRRRSREITRIEYGKKRYKPRYIDLNNRNADP